MTVGLPILMPLAGAIIVILGRRRPRLARSAGAVAALGALAAAVLLFAAVSAAGGPIVEEPAIGRGPGFLTMQADGFTAPLVVLMALAGAVAALVCVLDGRGLSRMAHALVVTAAAAGALLAADMVLWYGSLCALAVGLALYASPSSEAPFGGGARRAAAFLLGGCAVVLVCVAIIVESAGGDTSMVDSLVVLTRGSQRTALGLLAAGLLVLLPVFGAHTWLTSSGAGAGRDGTVVLAVVPTSVAAASLVRFCAGYLPAGLADARLALVVLGLASLVFGGALAWASGDARRAVGALTLANAGVVLVGIALGSAAAVSGIVGVLVGHGLGVMAVLLLAEGGPEAGEAPRRAVGRERGIAGAAVVLGGAAAAGVPGTVRFGGLAAIGRSAWEVIGPVAAVGLIGVAFTLAWAVRWGMTARPAHAGEARALGGVELAVACVLVVLTIAFGVLPGVLGQTVDPAAAQLAAALGVGR